MDRFGWDEATEWDYNQEAYGPSALDPVYESLVWCEHCGFCPEENEDKAKNFSNCCEEGAKEFRLEEASVEDWEDCPF